MNLAVLLVCTYPYGIRDLHFFRHRLLLAQIRGTEIQIERWDHVLAKVVCNVVWYRGR